MKTYDKKAVRTIYVTFFVIILFFLSACQPTPEKAVVVNKNDFEEKIQQSEAPTEKYQAPKSWKESISTENGFLSIVIDANVSIPDITDFPVVVIEPMQISQEQADKTIKAFFQNNILYEPTTIKTKSEIQEEILKIKAYLANKNSDIYLVKDSDPEYYEQVINELNLAIQSLEQQIEKAPDEYTPKPASLTFEDGKKILFPDLKEDDLSKIPDILLIRGEAYLGKKNPANIVIISDTTKSNNKIFFQNYDESANPTFYLYEEPGQLNDLAISTEEAIKTAENVLNSIGLSTMKLAAIGYDREVNISTYGSKEYPILLFTQSINGVPVNYVRDSSYPQAPLYSEPWPDESLLIGVNESGINRFEWTSPIRTVENVSNNVTLLAFDDIMAAFKEQAKVRDMWKDVDANIIGKEVHITKISLGLAKVPRENDSNRGLLVPAWDFYGYSIDKYSQHEQGGYELNENNEYINNKFMNSYITINAIDGSIIERTILR